MAAVAKITAFRGAPGYKADQLWLPFLYFQTMEKSIQDTFDIDRRSGTDRRKHNDINLRSMIGNGKRRFVRRQEDRNKIFLVDHYSPKLFAAIMAIIFLSVIDGLLTLYLMNHGAHEVNPVMAYYINVGPYTFFTLKFALTIIGAVTLLIFRDIIPQSFKVRTYSLLYLVVGVFMMTVAWELYLVFNVIV